ncbi:IucA/IucC family C-terminal-domain containing protein [soil metagenome]
MSARLALETKASEMRPAPNNGFSLSPLSETVGRISALADYLDFRTGIPDEAGWRRLTELTDPDLLEGWHWDVTNRVGDRRVAAAYMSNWLLSFLVGGWLLPVLTEHRLPLAGHAETAIRRNDGGWFDGFALDSLALGVLPDDPAAGDPLSVELPDRDVLFDSLADRLMSLDPVIHALRAACPIGIPALWGAVADAISSQALLLADLAGQDRQVVWRSAYAIIDRLDLRESRPRVRPRPFPVAHENGVTLFDVRGTCCLYYKTVKEPDRDGEGYCDSCPLRTDESRLTRLRASIGG